MHQNMNGSRMNIVRHQVSNGSHPCVPTINTDLQCLEDVQQTLTHTLGWPGERPGQDPLA